MRNSDKGKLFCVMELRWKSSGKVSTMPMKRSTEWSALAWLLVNPVAEKSSSVKARCAHHQRPSSIYLIFKCCGARFPLRVSSQLMFPGDHSRSSVRLRDRFKLTAKSNSDHPLPVGVLVGIPFSLILGLVTEYFLLVLTSKWRLVVEYKNSWALKVSAALNFAQP